MTSVLTNSEITLSSGKSDKQQRAKLSKRPKTPTTPRVPGSLSGSGFVTANSSAISVATNSGGRQSAQSVRMSFTGKRQESDNMPLPPPIKITPLGQVVGGSFPPTPPGSHSSISGGGAMTPRRSASPGRYTEGITPPFLQEERSTLPNGKSSRPSSAGSMFSRKKKEPKEKDRDSFFGRDGELGEDLPSKKRHSEEVKKMPTPKTHSRSSSSTGLGRSKGILVTPTSSVPHVAEWNYPPQRPSSHSAPIANRTVHHHEYHSSDSPYSLPPLSLPHVELFEGGFMPSRRPSSSSGVSPILQRRASTSSRHSLRDHGEDRRRQVYGSTSVYPPNGWNDADNPLTGFLTTSQGMYHDHLREEGGINYQKSSAKQSRLLGLDSPGIKPTGRPATADQKPQTNGPTKSGRPGLDRTPSESANARKSVESVAAVKKSLETLTAAAAHNKTEAPKPSEGGLTRKASVNGRPRSGSGPNSALRRSGSKSEFVAAAEKKKLDKGKGKEVVRNEERTIPTLHEITAAASIPLNTKSEPVTPKTEEPVTPKAEQPSSEKANGSPEHGFIFPFAQAVTVDRPVVLPSANLAAHMQHDEHLPSAVEKTINEAYQLPRTPEPSGTLQGTSSPTGPQNDTPLGIAPGDLNRASSSAGGFVGGWKLDSMMGGTRRFSRDVGKSVGNAGGVSASSSTSSNRTISSTGSGAILTHNLKPGLTRKYSYSTLEGMALVEGGRNGNEVTLTDVPHDLKDQLAPQRQHEHTPFRAVTVLPLPPHQNSSHIPHGSEISLKDGTLLPVPQHTVDPARPRSRAESPHWEPIVPVDRKKDKKKSKRRWFGSMRKDKEEDENKDTSKSGYSTGSSGSSSLTGVAHAAGSGSDRSNADSATPPSSAASHSSVNTVGKNGSSTTMTSGVGAQYNGSTSALGSNVPDFAYTSQRLNAMAAAAHPSGPPHLQYQHPPPPPPPQPFTSYIPPVIAPPASTQSQSVSVEPKPELKPKVELKPEPKSETKSQQSQTAPHILPQPPRGRARTRESGLRYEVRDSPSPTTPTAVISPMSANAPSSSSSSSAPTTPRASSSRLSVPTLQQVHQQHRKTHSVPSGAGMTAEQSLSEKEKAKPHGKLFVVCCNCEYWHDLPSQMYYEMHERGCTVKCVYCLHAMGVKCCTGYSCAVYVLQKHHGRI